MSWDTIVRSPLNCKQRTRSLPRSCRFAGQAGPSLCRNVRVSFSRASQTWRLLSWLFFFFPPRDRSKRCEIVHSLSQHSLQYFCCQLLWIAAVPNTPLLKDEHRGKDAFLLGNNLLALCPHILRTRQLPFFQSFRWQLSLELGFFHTLKMNLSQELDLLLITDTFLCTFCQRITNTLILKILGQITTVI